jgi:hypothetical protein
VVVHQKKSRRAAKSQQTPSVDESETEETASVDESEAEERTSESSASSGDSQQEEAAANIPQCVLVVIMFRERHSHLVLFPDAAFLHAGPATPGTIHTFLIWTLSRSRVECEA